MGPRLRGDDSKNGVSTLLGMHPSGSSSNDGRLAPKLTKMQGMSETPVAESVGYLELRPRFWRSFRSNVLWAALSLILIPAFCLAAIDEGTDAFDAIFLWLGALISIGVFLLNAVELVLPSRYCLKLTPEGWEESSRWGKTVMPWPAAERFYVHHSILLMKWAKDHPMAPPSLKSIHGFQIVMRDLGFRDRLGPHVPGFPAKEMLAIVDVWHKRALRTKTK